MTRFRLFLNTDSSTDKIFPKMVLSEGLSLTSSSSPAASPQGSNKSILSVDTLIFPPHLEERSTSLIQASESALEAEKIAIEYSSEAYQLSLTHSDREESKRIPNTKVRLFGGYSYSGTYVGTVDENFLPHGLGVFNETKGFAIGNGAFGNNRGRHGIKYRGTWQHGEVSGYGKLEQCQPVRIHSSTEATEVSIYQGKLLHGLKHGYGISRYGINNEIFYQGEYLNGMKDGYGTRYLLSGKANHHISYSNDMPKPSSQCNSPTINSENSISEFEISNKIIENDKMQLVNKIDEISETESLSSPSDHKSIESSFKGGGGGALVVKKGQGGLWCLDYPINKALIPTKSGKEITSSNPSSPKLSPKTPKTGRVSPNSMGSSIKSRKGRPTSTSPSSATSSATSTSPKSSKQFSRNI